MLAMGANLPLLRRLPVIKRRGVSIRAFLDPAAAPLRFLLIRRIANHHRDRLLAFHAVGFAPRFGHGLHHLRQVLILHEGIVEGVGDVEAQVLHQLRILLVHRSQRAPFGDDAQLRHRERSELQLETEEALHGRQQLPMHRARPLIRLHIGRDLPHHSQQKGPRAHSGIGHGDVL